MSRSFVIECKARMTQTRKIVFVREPSPDDENNFLAAMHRSQTLHAPWVKSPQTPKDYRDYLLRRQQDNQKCYLVIDQDENITGIFNLSEIVRGYFQNTYIGFYAVADYAGKGYMSAGLKLILQDVFDGLKLHRLEANIQPENSSSINLVQNNGFRKEGYSPHYLMVNDEWRDHERWAITREDWEINC